MSLKTFSVCLTSLAVLACSTDNQSGSTKDDNIPGVYVREQAVEVRHPESGDLVGMRKIRDSIFIEPGRDGYSVTNRKWSLNDYEKEGWVNMDHADDRPFPRFVANYDEKSSVLHAEGHTLKIDHNNHKLLREGTKRLEYTKVDK